MIDFACKVKPQDVCLVPERREEVTTEGGLDVVGGFAKVQAACKQLADAGIRVSLFIDPDAAQIEAAAAAGAPVIELHTGRYAEATDDAELKAELVRIETAVEEGIRWGVRVNAGHGLHYTNVQPIAAIAGIHELNIGHAVVARPGPARVAGERAVRYRVRVDAGEPPPVEMAIGPGEIVGFGGLVGGGRTRLARRLAGLEPGSVATWRAPDGETFTLRSARDAIGHGIVYLTEDRKRDGLFLDLPVVDNASAASLARIARAGWLSRRRERAAVAPTLERLRLVAASLSMPVRALSGGNQQKVLFARALLARPRVLVCDEPTRGVDVGAREEIYALLESLAAQGVAVLVVSSELKELIDVCHRLLVVRAARIVAELPPGARERDIVEAAVPAASRAAAA